ncbi:hypothetical protein NECID01_0593 [Nematocida sp. AWRm77]|nr:hypothetical protein NECID01_0593 [Nematocida sp. AWRm77]
MDEGFSSLATVFARCKIKGIVELAKGNRNKLSLCNTRAMEILRGMSAYETHPQLLCAMNIEKQFLKARDVYLRRNKLKKTLLNRAVYLAQEAFSPEFVQYVQKRRELFVNEAQGIEDVSLLEEMNTLVAGTPSATKSLLAALPGKERTEHVFEGVDLVFEDARVLALFKEQKYKEVLQSVKAQGSFDSAVISALARIEVFRKGKEVLEAAPGKKAGKTLARYLTQWKSLHREVQELFKRNFISTEYLERVDKEVQIVRSTTATTTPPSSVPLHPLTYDLASVYVHLKKTDMSSVSTMLHNMSISH